MTIELTPELEEALAPKAAAQGVSVAEFSLRILQEHVQEPVVLSPSDPNFKIRNADDALAWIKSRNPNPPKEARFNNIRDLAYEGHRY